MRTVRAFADLVRLQLRQVRTRPSRFVLPVAAIALATLMIVAVLGVYDSVTASSSRVGSIAGAADLEVAAVGDTGIASSLVAEVGSTPGVHAVVPALQSFVWIGGERTLLLGVDPAVVALGGKIGRMIPSNLIASPQRTRKRAARLQRPASARPCSLRVEQLEDRVTPSVNPLTPLQLQGDVFSTTAHDWNQVWIDAGSPNTVNAKKFQR